MWIAVKNIRIYENERLEQIFADHKIMSFMHCLYMTLLVAAKVYFHGLKYPPLLILSFG